MCCSTAASHERAGMELIPVARDVSIIALVIVWLAQHL